MGRFLCGLSRCVDTKDGEEYKVIKVKHSRRLVKIVGWFHERFGGSVDSKDFGHGLNTLILFPRENPTLPIA